MYSNSRNLFAERIEASKYCQVIELQIEECILYWLLIRETLYQTLRCFTYRKEVDTSF
jgi:hypothetical protein